MWRQGMTRQQRIGRSRMVSPTVLPLAGFTAGGFLFGMLVTKLTGSNTFDAIGFLNENALQKLSDTVFLPGSLFLYLMKRRFTELFFLFLLSMTFLGKVGMNLYLIWTGGLQGIFVMSLMQQYSWKGVGLFLVAMFPQCIFLVPSVWLLFNLNRRLYTKAYRLRCGGACTERRALFKEAVFCMGMYSAATWLQSYVNPFLLQKYLHLF